MGLTKGMENLDDFQKKYGNIYDEIFQRGQEAGSGANTPAGSEPVFEKIVQDLVSKGQSKASAIKSALAENPGAHSGYLERVKSNKSGKLFGEADASKFENFENAVSSLVAQGQKTSTAIRTAVEQYPQLHADYINRLQKGETGGLCIKG